MLLHDGPSKVDTNFVSINLFLRGLVISADSAQELKLQRQVRWKKVNLHPKELK